MADNYLSDSFFFNLSSEIRSLIFKLLYGHEISTLQLLSDDLKGKHSIDAELYTGIKDFFITSGLNAEVFIEGEAPFQSGSKVDFTVLIDPIDGSINRDLLVGDPGFVIAYSLAEKPRFQDIQCGYVYGIHSHHVYFSMNGSSFFQADPAKQAVPISCDPHIKELKDAILYYNDGYGTLFAKSAFLKAGALPFFVRHHNAFDNTALEICQICRGAAHLRVEARSYRKNGLMKGSDHANLLAAYAIGKPAGLCVTDLNGCPLDQTVIMLDQVQDFICAVNPFLLERTLEILRNNIKILSDSIHDSPAKCHDDTK